MNQFSVEIESLEPSVVSDCPVLPFTFSCTHFVGESRTFERARMIDNTCLTVFAVVELECGQVATRWGDACDTFAGSHTGIQNPCGDGVGCIVGEISRTVERTGETLFPVEEEGIFVLDDLDQQFIISIKATTWVVLDRFQHEGLSLRIVICIDINHKPVFVLNPLCRFQIFLMQVGIAAIDCLIVHSFNGWE